MVSFSGTLRIFSPVLDINTFTRSPQYN